MSFEYLQSQNISQDLSLSGAQLQSLTLLSMCNQDLKEFLDELTLKNPMLEKNDDSQKYEQDFSDWYTTQTYRTFQEQKSDGTPLIYADTFRELSYSSDDSIRTMILEQLPADLLTREKIRCVLYLIDNLDSRGFLAFSPEELAAASEFSEETLSSCIEAVRELEPAGIFASCTEESLIFQLKRKKNIDPASERIIREHFPDLIAGRFGKISRVCGISTKKIQLLSEALSECSPFPLASFGPHRTSYIIPDVVCRLENGRLTAAVNDRWVDNYALSDYYLRMMLQTEEKELRQYLRKKYLQLKMIRTNIEQRRSTLLRITETVLRVQEDFFLSGSPVRPMTMQQTADELDLNVSTISRTVNGKYLQYPGGTLALKDFFRTGVQKNIFAPSCSESEITSRIADKIAAEDAEKPLSDADLVRLLKEDGIDISRRTVAKYRQNAGILSSYQRKIMAKT